MSDTTRAIFALRGGGRLDLNVFSYNCILTKKNFLFIRSPYCTVHCFCFNHVMYYVSVQ